MLVGAGLLFGARVLAGLTLYAIAAGLPVGALLLVVPRGIPFEWHLILPTIADALMGLVYYLAALLAMQWRGPVFGSGLLCIIGALACSIAVWDVPRFSQALGVIGLAVIVYGAAAFGAQGSQGFSLRAAAWTRGALGLVVGTSLAAIFVLASWGGESLVTRITNAYFAYLMNHNPQRNAAEYQSPIPFTRLVRYVILPDATLGRQIYTPPPPEIRNARSFDSPVHDLRAGRSGGHALCRDGHRSQPSAALSGLAYDLSFAPRGRGIPGAGGPRGLPRDHACGGIPQHASL